MRVKISQLARKYAIAFLNVNSSNISESVVWDVKKAYIFLKDKPELLLILTLPTMVKADKVKALEAFMKKLNLPSQFKSLFELLLKHRRPMLVGQVLKYIYLLYPTYIDSLLFDFMSATELGVEEQKELKKFIEAQAKKNVIFEVVQDKSLIAGVRLQSRSLLWECSVRDRLNRLKALVTRG
jgi:F-type H+-transporting ATPase subunit delta